MAAGGTPAPRLPPMSPVAAKTMTLAPTRSRRRALVVALALCALLAAGVALLGGPAAGAAKRSSRLAKEPKRPNVVLIMTDDQALGTLRREVMPQVYEKLIGRGTTFSDYVVTTPLCCPSRATLLSGQYGHNNGVLRNFYPDLKSKRNVLPAWLQNAGYNTAHVGKFLNAFEQDKGGPAAVAPGWDRWFTELEPRRYYRWKASLNGRVRHYGYANGDHATKVMTETATRWTAELAHKDDPFYMQLDYYAPHTAPGRDKRCAGSAVPEPQDEHRFDGYPLPRPPSFNEEDVSDKPAAVRSQAPLDDATIESIERRYRCALESLYGVDRGIGDVIRTVKDAGELNRTVFIFASDNGFFYGEHRIPKGKNQPYEENIHMPLTIVVPPAFRDTGEVVSRSGAPVANIDLAPTILNLAKADPCRAKNRCRTLDGRSLMPLIEGKGTFPDPRPIGLEIGDCTYRGARFQHRVYFEYANPTAEGCAADAIEHYDLAQDPFQLHNLDSADTGSADGAAGRKLHRLTYKLRDCAGIRGRDPRPPSGHFCR